MDIHKSQNNPLKVAAPYYGSLNHPRGGQSNLFFVLDLDPADSRVASMHVTVWNPKDDNRLGGWLQDTGVKAFFCNNIESCHQQDLLSSGIRIEPLNCGDVVSGIKRWLAEAGTNFFNQAGQLPA